MSLPMFEAYVRLKYQGKVQTNLLSITINRSWRFRRGSFHEQRVKSRGLHTECRKPTRTLFINGYMIQRQQKQACCLACNIPTRKMSQRYSVTQETNRANNKLGKALGQTLWRNETTERGETDLEQKGFRSMAHKLFPEFIMNALLVMAAYCQLIFNLATGLLVHYIQWSKAFPRCVRVKVDPSSKGNVHSVDGGHIHLEHFEIVL